MKSCASQVSIVRPPRLLLNLRSTIYHLQPSSFPAFFLLLSRSMHSSAPHFVLTSFLLISFSASLLFSCMHLLTIYSCYLLICSSYTPFSRPSSLSFCRYASCRGVTFFAFSLFDFFDFICSICSFFVYVVSGGKTYVFLKKTFNYILDKDLFPVFVFSIFRLLIYVFNFHFPFVICPFHFHIFLFTFPFFSGNRALPEE